MATLGDFLDDLRKLDKRLDRQHAAIRDSTADTNVRLLTYFLRLHARRVARCTEAILRWDPKTLRAAALPPGFSFDRRDAMTLLAAAPSQITGPQLLDATVRYHSQLLDIVTAIRQHSTRGKIRCLLSDIIQLERQTVNMLQRMSSTQYF